MYNYENDQLKREYTFEIFFKGSDKYLLLIKNPPVMRNQAQMRLGDTIWYYLAKIRRLRRISAQSMFLDTIFTQEDVMYATLSRLYIPESMEETVVDGVICYVLTLVPRVDGNTYAKIKAYVDKNTWFPVKRIYYSYGGDPIKELTVLRIERQKDRTSFLEMVVQDLIRKGTYTKVVFDMIEQDAVISDKMFSPEYLEYVTR
ncbi:MAG: outer membrane lipoprotein-sorting protein [Treponemataceae bacterium]|nr:outer membrane lipoprotein-sorting protein [Treponemataceae bacterium]